MGNEPQNSGKDLLGLEPVSRAIEKGTTEAFDYLRLICAPAAKEFGLLLGDRVAAMRQRNLVAITLKSKKQAEELGIEENSIAHPRVVAQSLEDGSWSDDERLQGMWAGLITASRAKADPKDTNLIYISKLSKMTSVQAHILEVACQECEKFISSGELVIASRMRFDSIEFAERVGASDIYQLDQQLDSMRIDGVIEGGIPATDHKTIDLYPTPFAIYMYVRCQGSVQSPHEYFGLKPSPKSNEDRTLMASGSTSDPSLSP